MNKQKQIETLISNLPPDTRDLFLKKLIEVNLVNSNKPGVTKMNILIMQMVADGCKAYEIAEKTYLSVRTVESRILRLRKEFKCKNITHLAVKLLRMNVIK